MLDVFLTVILPTFLVAALGAVLQRWKALGVGALGPVAMYLLSPALVLNGLLTTELPAAISIRVVVSAFLAMMLMLGLAALFSALARQPRSLQSGFTLATGFPNAGNMGIPISFLAFGDDGLAVAIIIFVVQGSLSWPVGIYVAARGRAHGWAPLKASLKIPTLYAVPVALTIRATQWDMPLTFSQPIEMLADATIPVMLIILGFQLSQGIDWARWRSLASSGFARLIASAGVAYLVTAMVGLDGVAQQTVIIVAAMPTAVFTTILATEFDTEPKFVTSAVVVSTLVSIGTLTVLITLLRNLLG
ncbi:MAG: AEC family transporter [Chloroflexi bacterium]|nr:AEC family transporter [Chloroflexota bacterium]